MGVSDLIPGVSGGTVAVLLGIYDRLLVAISGVFSRHWRRHIGFLLPLGFGMAAALLSLSRVMSFLLDQHAVPTQAFFLGLVVGMLPMLWRLTRGAGGTERPLPARHWAILAVSALALAALVFVRPQNHPGVITSLTVFTWLGLFFSGWLASMAMLMPGISGAFVLLLLGVYPTAIAAVSTLNLPVLAAIGLGVAFGFILSSRGIRLLLKHYPQMTYAAITGLVIGSIAIIFPGLPASGGEFAVSLFTFVLGCIAALAFGASEGPPA